MSNVSYWFILIQKIRYSEGKINKTTLNQFEIYNKSGPVFAHLFLFNSWLTVFRKSKRKDFKDSIAVVQQFNDIHFILCGFKKSFKVIMMKLNIHYDHNLPIYSCVQSKLCGILEINHRIQNTTKTVNPFKV